MMKGDQAADFVYLVPSVITIGQRAPVCVLAPASGGGRVCSSFTNHYCRNHGHLDPPNRGAIAGLMACKSFHFARKAKTAIMPATAGTFPLHYLRSGCCCYCCCFFSPPPSSYTSKKEKKGSIRSEHHQTLVSICLDLANFFSGLVQKKKTRAASVGGAHIMFST
ncbi:hypothetical protein IF1G_05890 [Cordyceps javanica]|uniref:Uncharacterized protein n=1 Tax=Cordyceps javanica TaxID=43265 RepID=A0A545UZM3_9HYPO|nr:hypothetical protein IF1G_05890 [Cordyceps javanica]